MSSVERAKSFMQRKARLIALTAVPLASLIAITAPAKAGLILDPSGTDFCNWGSTGGIIQPGSSCTVAQLGQGSNGVKGVKMFGTATGLASGGGALKVEVAIPNLIGNGSTNGGTFPGGSLPLHWAFSITDSDTSADLTWTFSLSINGGLVFTQTLGATGNGNIISGNVTTPVLPSIAVTSYAVDFFVTDPNAVGGETLTVSIPSSSVDINAVSAGTPEPGTFALLGSALVTLGLLALWRRRATS